MQNVRLGGGGADCDVLNIDGAPCVNPRCFLKQIYFDSILIQILNEALIGHIDVRENHFLQT